MDLKNKMKLRKLEKKDAPFMLEWMHDNEIASNFRANFKEMTIDKVEVFIENSYTESDQHYAVASDDDEYLGTISLKHIDTVNRCAEYAVCLRKCAQGTGAAEFATQRLFEIAFSNLRLHRVYLNVYTDNVKANRFYQKMGFLYEGCSRDCLLIDGKFKSLNWYVKLESE